jgi:hypothetical protein
MRLYLKYIRFAHFYQIRRFVKLAPFA